METNNINTQHLGSDLGYYLLLMAILEDPKA